MTRISLKEAYDNRDVIAQIAKLNDVIDNLPNPDLTNVVLKTGAQTIAGVKTFTDQVILAGGMDLSALGSTTINGDLTVNGDIIQSGAAYETHVEQIYSHNDYIIMRDGAVNALPAGSYSGLQVKKYDGSADCRMVVDNSGVMRVGDINDEQPLATRDEVANMTSGALVKWDGVNKKLITSSANVGDDTQPVKIVGGQPVAVSGALQTVLTVTTSTLVPGITVNVYGKVVEISLSNYTPAAGLSTVAGVPAAKGFSLGKIVRSGTVDNGFLQVEPGSTNLQIVATSASASYGSVTYISE